MQLGSASAYDLCSPREPPWTTATPRGLPAPPGTDRRATRPHGRPPEPAGSSGHLARDGGTSPSPRDGPTSCSAGSRWISPRPAGRPTTTAAKSRRPSRWSPARDCCGERGCEGGRGSRSVAAAAAHLDWFAPLHGYDDVGRARKIAAARHEAELLGVIAGDRLTVLGELLVAEREPAPLAARAAPTPTRTPAACSWCNPT